MLTLTKKMSSNANGNKCWFLNVVRWKSVNACWECLPVWIKTFSYRTGPLTEQTKKNLNELRFVKNCLSKRTESHSCLMPTKGSTLSFISKMLVLPYVDKCASKCAIEIC